MAGYGSISWVRYFLRKREEGGFEESEYVKAAREAAVRRLAEQRIREQKERSGHVRKFAGRS